MINKFVNRETNLKALVFSDNHGAMENIKKVLSKEKDVDLVIHCGDLCKERVYLEALAKCPVIVVAGNCDSYSQALPAVEFFEFGKYMVMACHGHNYYVTSYDCQTLARMAAAKEQDLVMFGHTHVPFNDYVAGIRAFNPGSIERPRTADGHKTYGVLLIDDAGELTCQVKRLIY